MNKCNIIFCVILLIVLCIFTYFNSKIEPFANQCILMRYDEANQIDHQLAEATKILESEGITLRHHERFIPCVWQIQSTDGRGVQIEDEWLDTEIYKLINNNLDIFELKYKGKKNDKDEDLYDIIIHNPYPGYEIKGTNFTGFGKYDQTTDDNLIFMFVTERSPDGSKDVFKLSTKENFKTNDSREYGIYNKTLEEINEIIKKTNDHQTIGVYYRDIYSNNKKYADGVVLMLKLEPVFHTDVSLEGMGEIDEFSNIADKFQSVIEASKERYTKLNELRNSNINKIELGKQETIQIRKITIEKYGERGRMIYDDRDVFLNVQQPVYSAISYDVEEKGEKGYIFRDLSDVDNLQLINEYRFVKNLFPHQIDNKYRIIAQAFGALNEDETSSTIKDILNEMLNTTCRLLESYNGENKIDLYDASDVTSQEEQPTKIKCEGNPGCCYTTRHSINGDKYRDVNDSYFYKEGSSDIREFLINNNIKCGKIVNYDGSGINIDGTHYYYFVTPLGTIKPNSIAFDLWVEHYLKALEEEIRTRIDIDMKFVPTTFPFPLWQQVKTWENEKVRTLVHNSKEIILYHAELISKRLHNCITQLDYYTSGVWAGWNFRPDAITMSKLEQLRAEKEIHDELLRNSEEQLGYDYFL